MSHIVVIGAGTAGVPATRELTQPLGSLHKVTLVNARDRFRFVPSNPRVAVGPRTEAPSGKAAGTCLAETGDTGVASVALPQIPPRNVTGARTGKWVHLARIAFEKYFLRRVRTGNVDPVDEPYLFEAPGIERRSARPAMTIRKIVALAGASLLAMHVSVAAETLSEAWSAALQSHELIAAARAQRDAADLDLDVARSERLPQIGVTSAFTQLDTAPRFAFGDAFLSPPLFDGDNFSTVQARITVPVFTSGSIRHGIAAAASAATAAERQLESLRQNIKLDVAEAYVDILRSRSAVTVAESNVVMLTSHTSDAENRYRAGAVPRNDYLSASVALANAEQGHLQARNTRELSHAAYNRMLGRPLEAPVELEHELNVAAMLPAQQDLDSLLTLALDRRQELPALAARAGALREQSAVQRARAKPHVALSGGYARLENDVLDDDSFWMVGLGLQWSFFDSGRSNRRAAALDSRARAVMHERAELASLIGLQVRRAVLNRNEAESRLRVAERAVEQASENLRVARDRYRAGAGTNTEVIDAEALRAQSLSNRDNAHFDAVVAALRLAHAVGSL